MPDERMPLQLDESEASLALYALRFFIGAKVPEVKGNAGPLEAKLDEYLSGTECAVANAENVASILGARWPQGRRYHIFCKESRRSRVTLRIRVGGLANYLAETQCSNAHR